jgi:O-antigen ligase
MNSLASNAQRDPAFSVGSGMEPVILVGVALASAALLAIAGPAGIVVVPVAVGAVAVMVNPELGLYALLLALVFPVPIHVREAVIYPHDAVAVLTIIATFVMALRRRDLSLPTPLFLIPAACLVVSQIVSLVNATDLTAGGLEVLQQSYLVVLAPISYYLLLRDERTLRRLTRAFMILILAEAILVCAQFASAGAGNRLLVDTLAFGRATFGSSTRVFGTVGPAIGLLLVASSFLWLDSKAKWSWKLVVVMLHVLAIFATGARSAMLVFVFTLIFYILFTRKRSVGLKVLIPVLAGILIFVGIIGTTRFSESLVHSTDMRYRVPIDSKALRAVPEHPIIGHGPKSAASLNISIFGARKIGVENEYVARLYNTGLLGLAALFAFASVPVLASVSRTNRKHPVAGVALATAAIIVGVYSGAAAGCIFEGSLGQWLMIFYAMMLAAAQISRSRDARRPRGAAAHKKAVAS